jgi:hypothetical protein
MAVSSQGRLLLGNPAVERFEVRRAAGGLLPVFPCQWDGGDGGIRTLDRALQPYNGLANRRLQPLGHISGKADMPDAGASRKRQISGRCI